MASYNLSWDGSKEYILPPISAARIFRGVSTAHGRRQQLPSRGLARLNSRDSSLPTKQTDNSTVFPYKWLAPQMYEGPYKPPKTVASKFSKLPKLNFSESDHKTKQYEQKMASVLLDSTTCDLNHFTGGTDLAINGEGSMPPTSMEAVVNFKENVKKSIWHGRPITKTRETLGDRNITSAAVSDSDKATTQSSSSLDDVHSVVDSMTKNYSVGDKKEVVFPIIVNHSETTSKQMQQTSCFQAESNTPRRKYARAPLKPIQARIPPDECKFGVLLNGDIRAQVVPIKLAQRTPGESNAINSPQPAIHRQINASATADLNNPLIDSFQSNNGVDSTTSHLVDNTVSRQPIYTSATPPADLSTVNTDEHPTINRLSPIPINGDRDSSPVFLSPLPSEFGDDDDVTSQLLSGACDGDLKEIETGDGDVLKQMDNNANDEVVLKTKDTPAESFPASDTDDKPAKLKNVEPASVNKQQQTTVGESREIKETEKKHEANLDETRSKPNGDVRQAAKNGKESLDDFPKENQLRLNSRGDDQSLKFLPKAIKSAKRIKGLKSFVGMKVVDTEQYDLFRNEKIHSQREADVSNDLEDGSEKKSEIVETSTETAEIAFPYGGEALADFKFKGKYGRRNDNVKTPAKN